MASKQQQAFRMCVHPCPRYLTGGDTHILCVACLGERSRALRCASPSDAPILPDALSWGRSGSRSPGLWSRYCRGTAKAVVLGFAKGTVGRGRDGHRLISAFTWQVQCLVSGLGSTCCGFFRPDQGTDTATICFWGIRCCKGQCKRYWGLATSVSCFWGASWGCDKSGWETEYRLASREGGCSFKWQTLWTLLAF